MIYYWSFLNAIIIFMQKVFEYAEYVFFLSWGQGKVITVIV